MSSAEEYQDWRCANCGNRPPLIHSREPVNPCGFCGNNDWYLRTVELRFTKDAEGRSR